MVLPPILSGFLVIWLFTPFLASGGSPRGLKKIANMSMSTHRTNTAVEHHQDMGKHSENNNSYRRCITYHLVDLVSVESNLVVFVMPQNWNRPYANINVGSCSQRQNVWLMLRHVLISLYLYISLTFIQHMYVHVQYSQVQPCKVFRCPNISMGLPGAFGILWLVGSGLICITFGQETPLENDP